MNKLLPKIGLRAATILVVSVIVGSGVFKKIAPMAAELGSPILLIGCWVLAGLVSLAGALSTAEMASMYPNSGGEYIYFQKIYGRFFAFLYGWGNFTVMKSAAIAALAYIFSQSLNSIITFPTVDFHLKLFGISVFDNFSVKLVASALIVLLTYFNFRGVTIAERLSSGLTYLMFIAVGIFIFFGLTSENGNWQNLTTKSTHFDHTKLQGFGLLKALTLASLGAFWGYEGWNHIGYIGEEVKNPKRNLPISLALGTGIVIVIYVLLNIVFAYTLPIDYFIELTNDPNKIAAVEVANRLWMGVGGTFIAGLIVITTLNSTNSSILMSARILYAMAKDKLFFQRADSVHPIYKTPDVALWLQCFWSVVLIWSGSFDQLTDMLVFASFIYYGATALGVIILRIKHPEIERAYKVTGYPFVPLLFVLFCIILFVVTLLNQPKEATMGLMLVFSGIPFYWFWNKNDN